MLGVIFHGEFESVAVPHEALGEVGCPLALYDAAMTATGKPIVDDDPTPGAVADPMESSEGGQQQKLGVHLFADWGCSCVR
ncbi:unnamed protein product, partial [Sphacelaria rigidula]